MCGVDSRSIAIDGVVATDEENIPQEFQPSGAISAAPLYH